MEEILFYCQECGKKMDAARLALLNAGKCPACGSMKGFSTAPKGENDAFEEVTVLNDTDFL